MISEILTRRGTPSFKSINKLINIKIDHFSRYNINENIHSLWHSILFSVELRFSKLYSLILHRAVRIIVLRLSQRSKKFKTLLKISYTTKARAFWSSGTSALDKYLRTVSISALISRAHNAQRFFISIVWSARKLVKIYRSKSGKQKSVEYD